MVTKEEWNNVYFSAMAIASVAVGALGVVVGLLALKRSTEAVGVGSLESTHYLLTLPRPVSWLEAYQALADYGWQPNYIGLIYPGQVYQGRKLLGHGEYQYHVRTYDDGQVTGHFEVTPEWDLKRHLAGADLRTMTPQESDELMVALSQIQLAGVAGRKLVSGVSVNIPRVHYDDGRVLVEVRNPGEWRDIREFVQPDNSEVARIISGIVYG